MLTLTRVAHLDNGWGGEARCAQQPFVLIETVRCGVPELLGQADSDQRSTISAS
ncbi:MAG: hypothetical protein ACLQNU_10385 [Candidatus Dormibacteria bacterium]